MGDVAADVGTARSAVRAGSAAVEDAVVFPLDDGRIASSFVVRRTAGGIVDLRADLYFDRAPPAEVLLHRWS